MAGAIMRNVLEAALLTPTLVLALSMSAVAGPLADHIGRDNRRQTPLLSGQWLSPCPASIKS
jgi:hypothetical protein